MPDSARPNQQNGRKRPLEGAGNPTSKKPKQTTKSNAGTYTPSKDVMDITRPGTPDSTGEEEMGADS
ncbi:hypothetical protein M408DRAFT_330117, partial [Serendipita vermifera MAFF 305830]